MVYEHTTKIPPYQLPFNRPATENFFHKKQKHLKTNPENQNLTKQDTTNAINYTGNGVINKHVHQDRRDHKNEI